jgi:hypothetical protein
MPDPHPHPAIRHYREWAAGRGPEGDTPRGGTIGPPPPLPPGGIPAAIQVFINAITAMGPWIVGGAQGVIGMLNDPVRGPAFVAQVVNGLPAGSPAMFIGAWPYTGTQSPSPTAPTHGLTQPSRADHR